MNGEVAVVEYICVSVNDGWVVSAETETVWTWT